MKFLIIKNLLNYQQNEDMINLLTRSDLDFEEIIAENKKFTLDIKNLNKEEEHISFGSYNFAQLLKHNNFKTGHNLENLDLSIQFEKWGAKNFLNGDGDIVSKENVKPFFGKRFIRTIIDSKSFSAGVYTYEELKNKIINEKLLISSEKEIQGEYRFIIINGKIADNCSYKIGNKTELSHKSPDEFINFVNKLIECWFPTKHFVIDIASMNGKPYIIEVNNIHCSRFYNCSIYKIIDTALIK